MSQFQERANRARTAMKLGLAMGPMLEPGLMAGAKGQVFIEVRDAGTGEILDSREVDNIVTLDAGILTARLHKDSLFPNASQNNGLTMLGVGTGATGNILNPDAPQQTQRKLNSEIARKSFSASTYRNSDGVAVSYPTNIVDYTCTFGESEAVGTLNEMGLMSTYSLNPNNRNPINNGPTDYDPTIDVTGYDLLANYLTFSVVTKPATAVLTITWRFTY